MRLSSNRFCTLVLLSLGSPLFVLAQQSYGPSCGAGPEKTFNDGLLEKLVGEWALTGTMVGKPLEQQCSAKWVLNHEFLELDCRETKQPPVLKVRYEAATYIGCSSTTQQYVVNLLDVFGAADTLGFGRRNDKSIELKWDYPSGPFRMTMTWEPDSNSWFFLLRQQDRSGKWSTFAEKHLRRK